MGLAVPAAEAAAAAGDNEVGEPSPAAAAREAADADVRGTRDEGRDASSRAPKKTAVARTVEWPTVT